MLTREQILEAQDIKTETVEVPEWGGSVLVKGMTGKERDQFEATILGQRGKGQILDLKNFRAKLFVLSVVDEKGKQLFTQKDIDALGDKCASAINKVFTVAQRLSGLSEKDVDELTKNSEGAIEDSTSD